MSRTSKPCPGCGEVIEWRKADQVCPDCADHIKRSKKLDAETNAKAKAPTLVPVMLPWAIHAYPYIRHARKFGGGGEENDRNFYEAADTLLRCSGIIPPRSFCRLDAKPIFAYESDHREYSNNNTTICLEAPLLEQWRKLHRAVVAMVNQGHQNGCFEGSNALARLAKGEITVGQMNEWQRKA